MGNLLTSLFNSAGALQAFQNGLDTTQNNVSNSSTPGYAKQIPVMEANAFDLSISLPGGVTAGPTQSSRNAFAERNVQDQQSALGLSQQRASDLNPVQSLFDLSGTTGIDAALSGLFNSFSQLSVSPNDPSARQSVIDQAQQTAKAFQQSANGLLSTSSSVSRETSGYVAQVNQIADQIGQINADRRSGASSPNDAGADAQVHSALEQLSQLINFTALQQPDGTVTVYAGGQMPLVIGTTVQHLQTASVSSQTQILDNQGHDITGEFTGGELAGALSVENTTIPSYLNSLNTLAQGVADQVNTTLSQGVDINGNAPTTNLFSYNAVTGAALTLAVTGITGDQLAAALPGSPGGNGNALNLSALADAKTVNGFSFSSYYGQVGSQVGQDVSNAQNDQTTRQQLLNQAQSLREQLSGVSLDEEAARLLQFQKSYEAASKMVTILSNLTDVVINMIPQ